MIKAIETSSIWNGGEISKDMYKELQDAMVQSAWGIADKAKSLVPVGEGIPEHLRDTIVAKGKRKKGLGETLSHYIASGEYETALPGAFVFAGTTGGTKETDVYWAHFVEYGTYFKSAHPFLRPAADSSFNAVMADAERAGRRVVLKRRRARTAQRKAAG